MDAREPLGELVAPEIVPDASLFGGPFRWLVLAHGFSGLAFWSFYGTVFAEAAFRFGAGTAEMAILGASLSVPFILGSLLQGLVVDRWSPKWLSFIGCFLLAAAIPMAWLAGSLVLLFASSFVVGAAFATIEPARSALTALLIPSARLVRANGAISVSFQTSLVVGTLGGGLLLDLSGAGTVYAAALASTAVALGLLLLIPDVRQTGERPALALGDLRAGARTAWADRRLRLLLIVTVSGWTLINVFFVLEPLFVRRVLHQGGDAVLYLWGAHGTGALLGAIALSRTARGTGREVTLVCAGVAAVGVGILVYTGVGLYRVALVAAGISGCGFALFYPPLLALIQRVVSEEQRGRVTGLFVALQETMGLVSSLALLALAPLIVVRPTMVGSSMVLVTIGLLGVRAARRQETTEHDDVAASR